MLCPGLRAVPRFWELNQTLAVFPFSISAALPPADNNGSDDATRRSNGYCQAAHSVVAASLRPPPQVGACPEPVERGSRRCRQPSFSTLAPPPPNHYYVPMVMTAQSLRGFGGRRMVFQGRTSRRTTTRRSPVCGVTLARVGRWEIRRPSPGWRAVWTAASIASNPAASPNRRDKVCVTGTTTGRGRVNMSGTSTGEGSHDPSAFSRCVPCGWRGGPACYT